MPGKLCVLFLTEKESDLKRLTIFSATNINCEENITVDPFTGVVKYSKGSLIQLKKEL
jgi:hypothetical protein